MNPKNIIPQRNAREHAGNGVFINALDLFFGGLVNLHHGRVLYNIEREIIGIKISQAPRGA